MDMERDVFRGTGMYGYKGTYREVRVCMVIKGRIGRHRDVRL